MAGNEEYGLAKSLKMLYPDTVSLSRTTGYDIKKLETKKQIAEMSLDYNVFFCVSALGDFHQSLLVEKIMEKWQEKKHPGYLIVLGSSADTPVNGTLRMYNVEKRALRAYCRQLSQIAASEKPSNWKVTYVAPGNLHTPNQDAKMPSTLKLDCDYVAGVISWLLEQPFDINISELCLDRKQLICEK
jgi:NAD(P)-dependent dehydrogenase (short-subunit alcohol dehydrogenase family)